MTVETGRSALEAITMPSDRLAVEAGRLIIAGHDAAELLRQHGSPLYVAVEETLRANYRRIHEAFAARWPGAVMVLYAVKSNNTLAIRAVLSQEGAGGDCFGLGELHACLAGGTNPRRMVMNGSNKSLAEIAAAVAHGIAINIDSEAEIDQIAAVAPAGGGVPVNLRLKPLTPELNRFSGEFFKSGDDVLTSVQRVKWGFTRDSATGLVRRILATPGLELQGYSCHIGRFSNLPDAFAVVAGRLAQDIAALHEATGFWPAMVDIGGGWPRQREPESRGPALNPYAIEDYAAAAADALLAALAPAGHPPPALWLEPGRYIVGNAVLLLATVGAVKRDAGHHWVHVDASTNNLMRIDTSRAWHTILPATRMDEPALDVVDIVGSTCIPSVLGAGRAMPPLRSGDAVAILDAGMYAEAISNQFNGIGRPATVLVSGDDVYVIKRRETVADVFAHHLVPPHLAVAPCKGTE